MSGKLGAGDIAPDFSLPGTDGSVAGRRHYALSEFRGRPVVLVFYPADNSSVCTVQLTSYTADISKLAGVGAQVLALSPQAVDVHDGFSSANGGFAFPLLADVDKAVGAAYQILGPLGFYRRSIFVVDRDGIVRYAHRSVTSAAFTPTEHIVERVRELN